MMVAEVVLISGEMTHLHNKTLQEPCYFYLYPFKLQDKCTKLYFCSCTVLQLYIFLGLQKQAINTTLT